MAGEVVALPSGGLLTDRVKSLIETSCIGNGVWEGWFQGPNAGHYGVSIISRP
jgi:hypothetical protein